MTISSSGNSENVVRAATWAKNKGLKIIALTGFNGGRTAELATVNLHVDGDNYGIIEDVHQSLMHLMGQYMRHARMSEELIKDRRF
jgi:phosphoheptose isomerase